MVTGKFSAALHEMLSDVDIKVVRAGYQAPNMNAVAERWGLSVEPECTDRMIFFGEVSLHRALREFSAHYHQELRNQRLGNTVISRPESTGTRTGEIFETERLGGLLRSYNLAASLNSKLKA